MKRQGVLQLVSVCAFIFVFNIFSMSALSFGTDTTPVTYDDYLSFYHNTKDEPIRGSSQLAAIDGIPLSSDSTVQDLTVEDGWMEWQVEVPHEGFYEIGLTYLPLPGRGGEIELQVLIDGQVPFAEVSKSVLYRIWRDEAEPRTDNRGNELRPRQVEDPLWFDMRLQDSSGLRPEPFVFYFSEGSHVISLRTRGEPVSIGQVRLYQAAELISYDEYIDKLGKEVRSSQNFVKIQAEHAFRKSHSILYPISDRTSAATEPNHPAQIRLNTIGGVNWQYPGQWISWELEIPEDGFYIIGMRYRQNFLRGLFVTRKVWIDGEIPFAELADTRFPFSTTWEMKLLGDDEPYLLYLTKGKHELRLEVGLGEFAQTVRLLQDVVYDLNEYYRKIIMITSTTPDPYRDYNLDRELPEVFEGFAHSSQILEQEVGRIIELTGTRGSEAALLERIADQLTSLMEKPETIGQRLDQYKSNIGALSSWLLTVSEQPLELDYIFAASPGVPIPSPRGTMVDTLKFRASAFISSFIDDYSMVGNIYEDDASIDVWIQSGRDQAQILKTMIDDLFTPQTGIPVNLSLVPGAIVQATLAGKGPDIALDVAKSDPINLALRGAVYDLSTFDDFDEISTRFFPEALVPYTYGGGCYALPVTQNFNMMFYRTDVFADLELEPPQTWDDFYRIAPIIQRSNMEVGVGDVFAALLFQRGGDYYTPDLKQTAFDSKAAMEAFHEWTGFYTKYSFPLSFDFYNRFRTGEMPLGIQSYTFYNMLSAAAPEIRDLWEMMPIPGTVNEEGEIVRTQGGSGTAAILLSASKNKDAAWEFLKWWTSDEVQARYGRELEALMGPAARYDTANVEAFKALPWSPEQQKLLLSQWAQVKEIPEIPGSYYVSRGLENAFRTVVYDGENPRETFHYWINEINAELERKLIEFGLEDGEGREQ